MEEDADGHPVKPPPLQRSTLASTSVAGAPADEFLFAIAALKQKYAGMEEGADGHPVKPSPLAEGGSAETGTAEYLANMESTRALKVRQVSKTTAVQ